MITVFFTNKNGNNLRMEFNDSDDARNRLATLDNWEADRAASAPPLSSTIRFDWAAEARAIRSVLGLPILKIGDSFAMGPIKVKVTSIDSFGCTQHYGCTWNDDAGNFKSGWMPCEFVDRFTGF